MKLSDVMSAAGLAGWAELALVLFFLAFVAVAWRVLFTRGAPHWDTIPLLPLAEEKPLEADPTPRAKELP